MKEYIKTLYKDLDYISPHEEEQGLDLGSTDTCILRDAVLTIIKLCQEVEKLKKLSKTEPEIVGKVGEYDVIKINQIDREDICHCKDLIEPDEDNYPVCAQCGLRVEK